MNVTPSFFLKITLVIFSPTECGSLENFFLIDVNLIKISNNFRISSSGKNSINSTIVLKLLIFRLNSLSSCFSSIDFKSSSFNDMTQKLIVISLIQYLKVF